MKLKESAAAQSVINQEWSSYMLLPAILCLMSFDRRPTVPQDPDLVAQAQPSLRSALKTG
jgi:hypothetical protein